MSDVLTTAATTDPVTLAEAKRHLNVSTTHDDAYIGEVLDSVTAQLETRYSVGLLNQTRTLSMRGWDDPRYTHDRVICPPRVPLSSVTKIVYIDSAGVSTTASTTTYKVTTDSPGQIHEAQNNTWPALRDEPDNVVVTYVCGHGTTQSSVPANATHAHKMLTAHLYRNREAVVTGTITKAVEWGVDALMAEDAIEHYG